MGDAIILVNPKHETQTNLALLLDFGVVPCYFLRQKKKQLQKSVTEET